MLVWNAPKEPGGKILKYNVYIQSDGEVGWATGLVKNVSSSFKNPSLILLSFV